MATYPPLEGEPAGTSDKTCNRWTMPSGTQFTRPFTLLTHSLIHSPTYQYAGVCAASGCTRRQSHGRSPHTDTVCPQCASVCESDTSPPWRRPWSTPHTHMACLLTMCWESWLCSAPAITKQFHHSQLCAVRTPCNAQSAGLWRTKTEIHAFQIVLCMELIL